MYMDKQKAKKTKRRISEKTLFLFIYLGGWIGGPLGMYIFRHKIKKIKFLIGVPLIILFEIICILLIYFK